MNADHTVTALSLQDLDLLKALTAYDQLSYFMRMLHIYIEESNGFKDEQMNEIIDTFLCLTNTKIKSASIELRITQPPLNDLLIKLTSIKTS
ncbi:hypothetical protein J3L18_10765 [Mucilaginibacter gossypii]|uniref:hypothetical protein n=1 Tax=Mucilaginibacter gossypii TaxID=551996 RepID=UPI000DCAF70B|nr:MULTISPECIES: hypothetical protein [Mucilaginibacter]QTE39508.1 hypothetical protein J3L18_10765 [Mucilaginibacter gossypii]RAV56131.1 hypothetical protein DIU36_15360 [Mucilaginibacter rubeus]